MSLSGRKKRKYPPMPRGALEAIAKTHPLFRAALLEYPKKKNTGHQGQRTRIFPSVAMQFLSAPTHPLFPTVVSSACGDTPLAVTIAIIATELYLGVFFNTGGSWTSDLTTLL
jgi:hypothetical protein